MKRLLIHVGYPKAASTTLQNSLFLELHKQGAINFVARAWESGHFGALGNKERYKEWLDHICFADSFRADADGLIQDLRTDRVNFLSEGLFLMRERHFERLSMADRIARYFGPRCDQVQVLFVLRAQSSLIYSYFAQTYQHLKQRTFAEYVAHVTRGELVERERIFDYRAVLASYVQRFGRANVHIAFFEDFVQDKPAFSAALAAAWGIPAATVSAALGESRMNQTRQSDGTSAIKKTTKFRLRTLVTRALKAVNIDVSSALQVRVPVATEEEKRALFERFRESNRALAAECGLDVQRMQKYGYF